MFQSNGRQMFETVRNSSFVFAFLHRSILW